MRLRGPLVSLEVGFTRKNLVTPIDSAGPRAGLYVLLLRRRFLLLGFLLLLGLGRRVSHSGGTRWLKRPCAEERDSLSALHVRGPFWPISRQQQDTDDIFETL